MMAFNIIISSRVNLLYLTALLNSRVVQFWLRHRGKRQGQNYQLDKEPLLDIPLHVPAAAEQERVATLVGRVIEGRQRLSVARSSAEEVQLSRLIAQWHGEIQRRIEAIYGVADEPLLQPAAAAS